MFSSFSNLKSPFGNLTLASSSLWISVSASPSPFLEILDNTGSEEHNSGPAFSSKSPVQFSETYKGEAVLLPQILTDFTFPYPSAYLIFLIAIGSFPNTCSHLNG